MQKKFLPLIEKSIIEHWDSPALSDLDDITYLYSDFACEIKKLHLIFEKMELSPGDKVALCGKNSAHWAIAFFATLSYGAVAVNILHDFHPQGITDIINHSESKLLFADKNTYSRLNCKDMPLLQYVVAMEELDVLPALTQKEDWQIDKNTLFTNKYPHGLGKEALQFYAEEPESLAILNYTSGTTSNPKGVMLPYRSLWSNTQFAIDRLQFVKPKDHILCMLPMAHMYGLAFEILMSISKGCHIHFLTKTPSPSVLIDAFDKVKPTLILAVPLIIEKIIFNRVFPQLEKQPAKTMVKVPLLKNIVFRKVKEKLLTTFGGKVKEVIIGGAALNINVAKFLHQISFPSTVGYGMTECGPLISYAPWQKYTPGSCGMVVDRMQVKINSTDPLSTVGEILTKGDNLMLGYYKNSEATASVFTSDGWLKTGDLATIDTQGRLFIRGRSKSLILGASGQNIYPEEIEEKINSQKYVLESLVVSRNKKLVALVVPDLEAITQNNITEAEYTTLFEELRKKVNQLLPQYSQIHHVEIQMQEFAKTPKRSIRRHQYS